MIPVPIPGCVLHNFVLQQNSNALALCLRQEKEKKKKKAYKLQAYQSKTTDSALSLIMKIMIS